LRSIGVGLVEASAGAARLLELLRPRTVILVGTAGLYPGSMAGFSVGTAAVAGEIVLLPQILPGRDAYLPEIVPSRQRTTARLVRVLCKATSLPVARVANPVAITASRRAAKAAAKRSACALENLEAFAFARAAASVKIPFAVVLGVANHVGPSSHREWKKNAAAAAAAACDAVLAYIAKARRA
jgi:nucleoside phosphorylase